MACLKKILAMSALLSFSLVAVAELPFRSAEFAFSGEQLLSKISQSNLSGRSEVLYCRADVSQSGAAEKVSCYSDSATTELTAETQMALEALAFSPASVDGETVPVRMSFRIAYSPLSSGVKAVLIPNLGTMQSQYGRNYIAPQERLDISDWYVSYSDASWIGGEAFLGDGDVARVAATVKANGRPAMIKTIDAKRAHTRDAEVVMRTLRSARFIPGTLNGKVVPMQYMVAVHYERSEQAVVKR